MSRLSRFWKSMKGEEALEETEEALDAGEDEGLLMATAGQQGASAGAEAAGGTGDLDALDTLKGEAAAVDSEEAAQRRAESDDPREAAEGGAATSGASKAPESAAPPAASREAASGEESGPTAGAAEEGSGPGESSQGPDDPLAAFRSTVVEKEISGLTKDLEDISIEELMAELREVRSMLPAPPPDADNSEA